MANGQVRRVAVVGTGYSAIGRALGKTPQYLTAMASTAALDDAGLSAQDIDGIVAFTAVNHAAARPLQLSAQDMGFILGVPSLRWYEGATGPAFGSAFLSAVSAVASGSTDVCLVLRTILKEGATPAMTPPSQRYGCDAQFVAPFGGFISANWGALLWQRHNSLYGTGEQDTGHQAIYQREFALRNERALMREPLTMEDYLAARFISKPLRLLDCDYPVDAAAAVVVASEERARDCRKVPVFVESWAFGSPAVPDFYLLDDLDNSAPHVAARALWQRTTLRPEDVDVCGLYDGQISHTLLWLEALGLCAKGECGEFVRAGNTRLGGRLPTNCDGGAVNVGRVHGANHFIEVVHQLRGESGDRQKPGAKVGVSANAIGMMAAVALMSTE
jgi:acetyl-CoA acetyltransferase